MSNLPRLPRSAAVLAWCLGILVAGGCRASKESEQARIVTVDVAPVLLSQIQRTVVSDGLLYPARQAALVPKISAPVKKVHVERGAHVKAGQLLVELENRDLLATAAESRAAFDLAEATYETTSKAAVPQEVQKAELDVQTAREALDAQQAIYTSRQSLFKEGAIAQKEVNDAQVSLTQARSQYELARKHLEDLQGFAREQELKAAAAQRDAAKGRYDAAQAQLAYSMITSPIDGVVTDRPLYAGETAPAGNPVITVMDTSRVIARVHVSQTEARELTVGNDANLIGGDNVPVPGKVVQISPALDATNTTVEVWVQADNREEKLKPGTSLSVEMIAKTIPSALVIPRTAVLTSASGATYAMVIDPDNKPHLRKIAVGLREKAKVQVTDGLESGQRVATTGAFELFKLDPDVLGKTKVQIAPAKEEEEPEES
ncbi:MAG: efflux RND transporter periplasmic adaptor subunit [Blastocatellia bacterium]|nr:MAG: efflux RND transporter periplasmic adaptor subunit [Blastocatellia bacterium]